MRDVTVDFDKKTAAVTTEAESETAREQSEKALRAAGYGIETFRETDPPPPGPD